MLKALEAISKINKLKSLLDKDLDKTRKHAVMIKLKQQANELKKECEAIIKQSEQDVVLHMLSTCKRSETYSDLGCMHLKTEMWASIPDEHREAAYSKLKDIKELSGLVKESVNSRSLTTWVREQAGYADLDNPSEEQVLEALPAEIRDLIKVSITTKIALKA